MTILDYSIAGLTAGEIVFVATVLALSVVAAKIATTNLRRALADKISRDQLDVLLKAIYAATLGFAIIAVSPILGLNISGLLVAGGIAGIVIGFASQSVVANFVSGLFLLWERPIKIGDQIGVDGIEGFVEDIKVMSTIVRTYDGLYVRIPNEKVFVSSITNYIANVARKFGYVISVSYGDDAEVAMDVIGGVIEEHPFVLKHPSPQIFVDELGESGVNIVVKVWAPASEWYDVRMDLLWRIKRALDEAGIEIPFPQRVVWFANELGVKGFTQHPEGDEDRESSGSTGFREKKSGHR